MLATEGQLAAAGTRPAPPPPAPPPADAVIDPRLGSHGAALLALEDGTVFAGHSFGAVEAGWGDLVVNTSATGYQEIGTDPSYAGQLVVMTSPLIGNHGCVPGHDQSARPWLRGLIVSHATSGAAVGEGCQLVDLLRNHGVAAICGVDTRALARHLRNTGSQRAVITPPGHLDPAAAVAQARRAPRWEDQDLISQVSVGDVYQFGQEGPIVAVLDMGLKAGIVGALTARGLRVRVLPHTATAKSALRADVSGIVLSPGPGDPARLEGQVDLARAAIADGRPLLGICLGHQIVARAAGAETRRLRFGHHGANHPVQDLATGRVQVTAQNHEVEVIGESLPAASGFVVSQRDLNDGSVEGLRHRDLPFETVQYHPEGSPGPWDAMDLFDRFAARLGERTPMELP